MNYNGLNSTAAYQTFIDQITSPVCPLCGNWEENSYFFCLKWAAERQHYFDDSIDLTDVFQDYDSLISSGHFPCHLCIGTAWPARQDNNNKHSDGMSAVRSGEKEKVTMIVCWSSAGWCVKPVELSGHESAVQSLSWRSDGCSLASTCKDKQLRLFDVRAATVVQVCWRHSHYYRLTFCCHCDKPHQAMYVWCGKYSEEIRTPTGLINLLSPIVPFFSSLP